MVRKAKLIVDDYKGELLEVEGACRKNLSIQSEIA
jgi:hypothetical protein